MWSCKVAFQQRSINHSAAASKSFIGELWLKNKGISYQEKGCTSIVSRVILVHLFPYLIQRNPWFWLLMSLRAWSQQMLQWHGFPCESLLWRFGKMEKKHFNWKETAGSVEGGERLAGPWQTLDYWCPSPALLSFGKDPATESGEFLEKFQTAFDPPLIFGKLYCKFL